MTALQQENPALTQEQATALLQKAAAAGDLESATKALVFKADVHANCDQALRDAAKNGHTEVVKLLLDKNANIHAYNEWALRLAAQYGHTETVKLLIERKADVHALNNEALREAAKNDHAETVKLLLSSGADIHAQKDQVLVSAAQRGSVEMVKLLLDNGADIHAQKDQALVSAAQRGSVEVVKLLLDNGADVHAQRNGAMGFAVERCSVEMAKLLLNHGAEIPRHALSHVGTSGSIEMAKLLLDNGTNGHNCALFYAARRGSREMVMLFLNAGANDYSRALDIAALEGHIEIVKLLLESGADIHAENNRALSYAAHGSRKKTVAFLKLAAGILDQTQDKKNCKSFFDTLNVSYPDSLKSDAFQSSKGNALPHLTSILLSSAHVAAILGGGDENFTNSIFAHIVGNDIKRIESTTGLSYRTYGNELRLRSVGIENFSDVVTEVTEAVTFPKLATKFRRRDVEELFSEAQTEAVKLVVAGKTSLDFPTFNHKWHRVNNRIPIELRPFKRLGEWHPLFQPIELKNGMSVECITTPVSLEEEGRMLKHCVGRGNYSAACQKGDTHIISIRKSGVPIGTIELGRGRDFHLSDGQGYRVVQFRGLDNEGVPPEGRAAWEEARKLLMSGAVTLSHERGITEESKRTEKLKRAEQIAGFPLVKIKHYQEKILAHYASQMRIQRGRNATNTVSLIDPSHFLETCDSPPSLKLRLSLLFEYLRSLGTGAR